MIVLTCTVRDTAGVPTSLLIRAEKELRSVYAHAGVTLLLLRAGDAAAGGRRGGTTLGLTILPGRGSADRPEVLGFAAGSEPRSAYVWLEQTRARARRTGLSTAVLLGHVMAHELAHLLLSFPAHSEGGLMRADWTERELLAASRGHLRFSPEQAAMVRLRASALASPPILSTRAGGMERR